GQALRYWFMTFWIFAYYTIGVWAAVFSSLYNYGILWHGNVYAVLAFILATTLLALFMPIVFIAMSHIGTGFASWTIGKAKGVARVRSWVFSWPRRKLSRYYGEMENRIDPITGKTYGILFREMVDHYYDVDWLSEYERDNLKSGRFVRPNDKEA